MDFGFMIGFSLGFVDDLWSNLCYVDLLLMLDYLDACNVIKKKKKTPWEFTGVGLLTIDVGWGGH